MVVAGVAIANGGNDGAPSGGGAPGSSAAPSAPTASPTVAGSPQRTIAALEAHLPGLREVRGASGAGSSYVIQAAFWSGGSQRATVVADVSRGTRDQAGNPCVLAPGEQAGKQGAPTPEDRCTAFVLANGSTVWLHREDGRSASRPGTSADTKVWELTQLRPDSTLVRLLVTNAIDTGARRTHYVWPQWQLATSTLVSTVADPRIALGGCDSNCGVASPSSDPTAVSSAPSSTPAAPSSSPIRSYEPPTVTPTTAAPFPAPSR